MKSPMGISLNSFEIKKAIQEIKDNFHKAEFVEELTPTAKLYHLNLGQFKYYFDMLNSGDIVYFVRYKVLDFKTLTNKPVRQCLVWRDKNKDVQSTAELPKLIFWDRLFSKYKACISDSQQTKDGEGFWIVVVKKAYKLGLSVKIHNTNDWKVIEEPTTFKDFLSVVNQYYGDKSFFQRYIISIEDK